MAVTEDTAARTLHVPDEFASVSGAVAAAGDGDSVVIAPGTYPTNVQTGPKYITFLGEGAEVTILDGAYVGRVLYLQRGGKVKGVTVRRGYDPGGGGGMVAVGPGALFMEDCIFEDNVAGGYDSGQGGAFFTGISLTGCRVTRCVFRRNQSGHVGGAVADYVSGTFTESRFEDNEAAHFGGAFFGGGYLINNVFVNNIARDAGGALYGYFSEVRGNTLINNRHLNFFAFGAGMHIEGAWTIAQNLVYTSDGLGSPAGVGIWARMDASGSIRAECNNSWGGRGPAYYFGAHTDTVGGMNLSVDPQFCGVDMGNYTLYNTSPCVNGPGNCGQIGAFGAGCSAVPVIPTTWGRIKALIH